MPSVTFDFGETTRSLPADVAAAIIERLLARTTEAKSEVAYQLAISIQARLDGTTERAIPMSVKEERDELWEIVNPLRSERQGDQWLDLLWQALFSARLEDHDPIELIRAELVRLGAGADAVGPQEAIYVQDRGSGFASLEGSAAAPDLGWYGPATDILERLSSLPDRGGPEAVRSEFHI